MTYILQLQDIKGAPLNEGDLVKISSSSGQTIFYSEVKYMEEEQAFSPFHTFAFHAIEKVESIPEAAIPTMSEERYRVWYLPRSDDDSEPDDSGHEYITSWRECEYLLNRRCFSIKKA